MKSNVQAYGATWEDPIHRDGGEFARDYGGASNACLSEGRSPMAWTRLWFLAERGLMIVQVQA